MVTFIKKHYWWFMAALASGMTVVVFGIGWGQFTTQSISESSNQVARTTGEAFSEPLKHYAYIADEKFYEHAFATAKTVKKESRKVWGAVLPHHLLVADKIAGLYSKISEQEIKTVVIVGPNHFQVGAGNALISRAAWETPYGVLQPESSIIRSLEETGAVRVDERPFEREHSISTHVAFIKRAFPNARIVPIILKFNITSDEVKRLTDELAKNLKKDTLVIASVDFSHHLPAWVADYHDELTLGLIQNFDVGRISHTEVDSPASLALMLSYLADRGAKKFELVEHTNSAYVLNQDDLMDTTSHGIGYFLEGSGDTKPVVSVLFFPDIMLGRQVAALSEKSKSKEYPFQKLAGDEGLFFRGFDRGVANLEGPITTHRAEQQKSISFAFDPEVAWVLKKYHIDIVSLANNHGNDQGSYGLMETKKFLEDAGVHFFGHPVRETEENIAYETIGGRKLAFVGMNLTDHSPGDESLKRLIETADSGADTVFVFVHWGSEYKRYPTKEQERLGRLFVDWGADVVIGHHPHVVQTIAEYKGKMIFYSLGNFIFDQYFSQETQEGLALGTIVRDDGVTFYFIPYTIPRSQPTLMGNDERNVFLKMLAADSRLAPDMLRAVESGVVTLPQ